VERGWREGGERVERGWREGGERGTTGYEIGQRENHKIEPGDSGERGLGDSVEGGPRDGVETPEMG
jgi:hypothetical protein